MLKQRTKDADMHIKPLPVDSLA